MNGFVKCPACGLLDNRRTRCGCGYTLTLTDPVAGSVPRQQPSGQPPSKAPWKLRDILQNTLIVIIWMAACGLLVYFLGRGPSSYAPPPIDTKAVSEELDRIKQIKQSQVAEREDSYRKLTRLLQSVKDKQTAQDTLFQCFLRGGAAASVGLMEARLEATRDVLPGFGRDFQNREKGSEASEKLIAEIKNVARRYPRAFRAASERFMDVVMPNRIKPPRPIGPLPPRQKTPGQEPPVPRHR
jgi:hypothetical protein